MHRLFAALSIPDHIAEILLPLQTGLPQARWRPRENFHITLKFYGEVDHATAGKLHEALSDIKFEPFAVALRGSGWFGGKKPQSVWAGIAPNEHLTELHKACSKAARTAGLSIQSQNFAPHITMAYCRTTTLKSVLDWVTPNSTLFTPPFSVNDFHLYSSHLSKGSSVYSIESQYKLQGRSNFRHST